MKQIGITLYTMPEQHHQHLPQLEAVISDGQGTETRIEIKQSKMVELGDDQVLTLRVLPMPGAP